MRRVYLTGTEVEGKDGRIKKKISAPGEKSEWISKGRYEFMKQHKIDLKQNQRVFFIDGDCHNFAKDNLTYVTFSGKRYERARSGIWWAPKGSPKLKEWQPKKKAVLSVA